MQVRGVRQTEKGETVKKTVFREGETREIKLDQIQTRREEQIINAGRHVYTSVDKTPVANAFHNSLQSQKFQLRKVVNHIFLSTS